MEAFLLKIDYWFFDLINQKVTFEAANLFFPWITDLNRNIYFKFIAIPLLLYFFIKAYKRTGLTLFIFLVLALSLSDFTGAQIKNQVLRLRPFENSEIISTQRSPAGSKSFYSNHASNMFTLAAYTSQFVPVLKIPLFVLASTVAYSRVYNGVHYPSDVIAGALMGYLWGYLFSLLAKKILKTIAEQKDNIL